MIGNRCQILLPSSGIVDMYDDDPIALTYQIADIKEPQKRHSDYSKTIKVPGTHNNNALFCDIFDIGIDRYFNPNRKSKAILVVDKVPVMTGYLRLRNIINTDGKKEYECEIVGRTSDFFTSIGETALNELGWDDLNHVWSYANVVAGMSPTIGSNYCYPFIDYGRQPAEINYKVDDFYPATFVKEIWDRIFRAAGFQYSSTFLTSTLFKRLIIPFNEDKMTLTEAQINARIFRASRASTDQSITVGQDSAFVISYTYDDIIFNNDTTSPNRDTGGVYNTGTGVFTVCASGYYNVSALIKIQRDGSSTSTSPQAWARIIDVTNTPRQIDLPSQIHIINGASTSYQISLSTPNPIFLSAGTQIKCQLAHWNPDVSFTEYISQDSYFQAQADPTMHEGDTILYNNVLPQKIKAREFVQSIIKMFNLYWEYDKDVPNKIYIEPRNDYYGSTVIDWTQKRDFSKELEITPMGALQAREYRFAYKPDNDFLNKTYQDEYKLTYGEKVKKVDNDFLTQTQKEELIFSPTPQYSTTAMASGITPVSTADRFFPKIIKVDSKGAQFGVQSNIRILYFSGLTNCKPWTLQSFNTTPVARTSYAMCGHADAWDTPTLDLNFAVPKEVYYTPPFGGTITNNNLYNKYWKQEIDEITDVNSSIVTGWFMLTVADINTLDFRNVFRFDFQNFRLNKIYDFNPLGDGLTKCEFIKIKNGIPYCVATAPALGDPETPFTNASCGSPGDPDDGPPWVMSTRNIQNNSYNYFSQINVQGFGNMVSASASNVNIIGSYNSIGNNANNISLINSSGVVVLGGLQNVTVFNSSGVTISESNTMVINNVTMLSPSTGAMSGRYTPSYLGATSGSPSVTMYSAMWTRVGSIVTVTGFAAIDTNGACAFTISLPIATTMVNSYDCAGVIYTSGGVVPQAQGHITADGYLTAADIYIGNDTFASQAFGYTLTYEIL